MLNLDFRLTPGIGYLESLRHEKTEVVFGGISKISEQGCVTEDGKEHPVDVLICAVGLAVLSQDAYSLRID